MRASIDYMNARRAAKAAAGGSKWAGHRYLSDAPQYAPDTAPEPLDVALSAINSFALWAEASRARYLKAIGMTPAPDRETDIPF